MKQKKGKKRAESQPCTAFDYLSARISITQSITYAILCQKKKEDQDSLDEDMTTSFCTGDNGLLGEIEAALGMGLTTDGTTPKNYFPINIF